MPFRLAPYQSCPFCAYICGEVECAVIAETELALAIVNKTQYERGAALVIPKQHRETILEITPTEIASVYTLAKRIVVAGEAALGAIGANVFQNNGIKAGQHVPHMHVHVVPRYEASDPEKLFLQRDFAIVDLAELKAIAATIRAAL
jgi:histidine triad (HIT) family protein